MSNDTSPSDPRRADFRVVFRGYDQAEVAARLDELSRLADRLEEEKERLTTRLGEFAERDLKSEFESVGREVSSVLEAARIAAETMRDRASADAARWRSEATAEAETMRKEARSDSEALRSDAWSTGSQLLDQVSEEVERLRRQAERDSLSVIGEAERKAHRLTAAGRREAEESIRSAKMEAEKVSAQAKAEYDDLITTAQRQAEAAQERTRALEQRRGELMTELESVRAALSSVEGELEDKRQGVDLSEEPALPRRALVSDEDGVHEINWEDGHTVRVIHPSRPTQPVDPDDTDADSLAEEVARLRDATETPESDAETEVDQGPEADSVDVAEAIEMPGESESVDPGEREPAEAEAHSPEPAPEAAEEAPAASSPDGLADLFARLRTPEPGTDEPQPSPAPQVEDADEGAESQEQVIPAVSPAESAPLNGTPIDPFATRERLLLPITNAALRSIKRTLTDAQNEALERLRVNDGEWMPDTLHLQAVLREDLIELVEGSARAGIEAAAEMGVEPPTDPETVEVDVDEVGSDLTANLVSALESSGSGARERSAATSRVFRGWRSDEAERRVRSLALESYHHALRGAFDSEGRSWRWEASGRMCPSCRDAADTGRAIPPAHRDCACTILLG